MQLNRRIAFAATLALFIIAGVAATRADTYPVTDTTPSGPGSLAQAIFDSNSHAGQDTIVFNIPGSGVHLIDLSQGSLPQITDSVILDGYTQPGAHPNTSSIGNNAVILIQLDGGSVKRDGGGLVISGSNCLVRGLAITRFQYDPASDPLLRTLGGFGIQLLSGGSGNVIQGNFIGLNPDGITPMANYVGVQVDAPQSMIGGTEPAARNVISGNGTGARILGAATSVVGNYIGTDATGMRVAGNVLGVAVGTNDVVVGGPVGGAGNLISGNADGIYLGVSLGYHVISAGDRAVIQGNLIGTKADGVGALGNSSAGIHLFRSSDCTIGGLEPGAGNVIAFNPQGVVVISSGNSVLSNSIYANQSRGIVLAREESNNGQRFPVLTSESISNGTATIGGTLQSTPNTQFLVQLFADSQSLTTSKQTYLGSTNVMTDNNGNGTFMVNFPWSDTNVVFNATATDPDGNTSEFFRHPAYLQNISTRAAVGSGENALIGGFITQFANIVARGIGPSLKSFGFANVLADPILELHNQTGAQVAFNDNWKDGSQAAQIEASGLAPTDDAESAMLFNSSGFNAPYTVVLQGKADAIGIGVVEAYTTLPDDDLYALGIASGFANLSSRGSVGTDDNVLIGGFIIGGGNESPRIVVRAIGPSLNAFGVANPLPDPVLELHDGNGLLIESNDNWADAQKDELQTVGLAPNDTTESAILMRLAAGAYTAIVRGKGNATGVALVEVYNLR